MMTTSLFFISTAFLLTQEAFDCRFDASLGAQPQGLPSNATQIAELGNYGPEKDPVLHQWQGQQACQTDEL
jgi:hypothetical protein